MQTRADATMRAITLMKETIAEMREEPVTDEELQTAKDGYLNSFVFNFTSPQQIVSQQASYEFHGYPKDYLKTYRENIDHVTQEDVLRVAQQFLHPDHAVLMVVGQSALFDEPLDAFGTVTRIDLEEPSKE